MGNIFFLYLCAREYAVQWLLLTILVMVLEFATINAMLPLFWESQSAIGDTVTDLYARVGIEGRNVVPAGIIAAGILYVVRNAVLTAQRTWVAKITTTTQARVKTTLLAGIENANYEAVGRMDAGVLSNALHLESGNLAMASRHLVIGITNAIFALSMLALVFYLEPVLSVLLVPLVLVGYVGITKATRLAWSLSVDITRNHGRIQSLLVQMLSALTYIKGTSSDRMIGGQLRVEIERQRRLVFRQQVLTHIVNNSSDLVLVLLMLSGLFVYVVVMDHSITEGVLLFFILRRSFGYMMNSEEAFRNYSQVHGSVGNVRDLQTEIDGYAVVPSPGSVPPDFSGPIRLENVSFAYANSDRIFDGLNLEFPRGSKIAIVGASGVGKSTLTKLMTGILDPSEGRISLSGNPYGETDLKALRSRVGYVPQDAVMFNDSIVDNVTLWDPGPSWERVQRALIMADAWEFVNELPEQLHTSVGDYGHLLSGGQCQRIALARELYKQSDVLILDEALTGVDDDGLFAILQNIISKNRETSLLFVTHRINATSFFDRVCVLDRGKIVEDGSYDELHRAGGIFRAMADAQVH